jgi:putative flippase GtrA
VAEIAGFFIVGLAGLALTQVLLYALVSRFGLSVPVAKAPVVGIVFFFNFVGRRTLVFVGRPAAASS